MRADFKLRLGTISYFGALFDIYMEFLDPLYHIIKGFWLLTPSRQKLNVETS